MNWKVYIKEVIQKWGIKNKNLGLKEKMEYD